MIGHDMAEPDIVRQRSKERNSFTNQYRHASNNETLDQTRAQKPLNRNSTVDVGVVGAAGSQPRNYLGWSSGHPFNHPSTSRGQVDCATTQNHNALVAIGPRTKG